MSTASTQGSSSVLDLTMHRIDGTPQPLSAYRGQVVLVVNVASKCGLTKQYAALETLYAGKKDEGLVVLGFPANDFMGQEPGTNEEIAAFCSTEYGVTFPMFQKIVVTGDDAHPLFRALTAQSEAPTWNFTKYLLDREGNLVHRFDPRTTPDDPALRAEIDRLLSAG
jgi:glutathione peroxidase